MVVPDLVRKMLNLNKLSLIQMILPFYKFSRIIKMDTIIRSAILPSAYQASIKALDIDH
jgi:hypothetical protein